MNKQSVCPGAKLYIKRCISILMLIAITFGVFFGYCVTANSERGFDSYYHLKGADSLDILAVGSSHTYNSIVPKMLWENNGYSSYVLGSGRLSPWYGYYYLVEALKYSKPKLVLFDCYTSVFDPDKFDIDEYPRMNLVGMMPSFNKLKALKSWGADDPIGIFWNFPIMHTRYADIDWGSFYHNDYEAMGYQERKDVKSVDLERIEKSRYAKGEEVIFEQSEWAIRSAIELCRKNGIEILLVNAPTIQTSEQYQRRYNYVEKIAAEYDVSFLNGNLYYDEIGIDGNTDCTGDGHLSLIGAQKYTNWLGKHIEDKCDLGNHKESDGYEFWRNHWGK